MAQSASGPGDRLGHGDAGSHPPLPPTASTSRAQILPESQPPRVRREKSEPVIITWLPRASAGAASELLHST